MRRLTLVALALALVGMFAPAKADDVEGGISLTLHPASDTFEAGVPFAVDGQLAAWIHVVYVETAAPLPGRDVEIRVDDVAVRTLTTGNDGRYATDLLFDWSLPEHRLQAVAFAGSALEARSPEVVVRLDRIIIGLEVRPASASIPAGGTVQLQALVTDDDGREQDVTAQAAWSSSDPAVATVSNAGGSPGLVTGVAPGSATITAAYGGDFATASITVT